MILTGICTQSIHLAFSLFVVAVCLAVRSPPAGTASLVLAALTALVVLRCNIQMFGDICGGFPLRIRHLCWLCHRLAESHTRGLFPCLSHVGWKGSHFNQDLHHHVLWKRNDLNTGPTAGRGTSPGSMQDLRVCGLCGLALLIPA